MRKKRTRTKRKSNKSYNRKKTKAIKKGRAKRSKKMRGGMRGMSYEEGIVKKILEEGRVLSPDPWWDEAIDTNSKFRVITKSIQDVNDAVKNGSREMLLVLENVMKNAQAGRSLLEARIRSLEDIVEAVAARKPR